MKVSLKITHNALTDSHEIATNEVVNLGRSNKSDISLGDTKVSSRHCRLFLKKHRLEISDTGSKNGTYLNGIRIDRSEVFIGDEIKIGDCTIVLDETAMNEESINLLTFPGSHRDRINFELRADFTGARIQNQLSQAKRKNPRGDYKNAHETEIKIRKIVKSKLKLSKQEIKGRHKVAAFFSFALDAFIMLCLLFIPPWLIENYAPPQADQSSKMTLLLALETGFLFSYGIINFKMNKFTLGEKLAGIKKRYKNQ